MAKTATPPQVQGIYLPQVINMFIEGIPEDRWQDCLVGIGAQVDLTKIGSDERTTLLGKFVDEKLRNISLEEYGDWLNGKMPFVTFRELQLWRFQRFAAGIWFWNVPEAETIAMIFNLTKTKANNLISDFKARFGKMYILPWSLHRFLYIITNKDSPMKDRINDKDGRYFVVPSPSSDTLQECIFFLWRGHSNDIGTI